MISDTIRARITQLPPEHAQLITSGWPLTLQHLDHPPGTVIDELGLTVAQLMRQLLTELDDLEEEL